MFLEGLSVSLKITAMATVIGIFRAFVAIFRIKRIPVLSNTADAYVSVIRGTPVNVQLIITYFIIFRTPQHYIGCFALVLTAELRLEIIRSGIQSASQARWRRSFAGAFIWQVHETGYNSASCEKYSTRLRQ